MFVLLYGTLKTGYRNHYLMEGQRFVRNVETEPLYKLHDNGTYPMMIVAPEGKGVSIKGELWEVDAACAKKLDWLECVPSLYKRAELKVKDSEENPIIGYIYQRNLLNFPECGREWAPKR